MKGTMRILFVEDSEDEAALAVDQLRCYGFDPVFERVETADAMRTALQRKIWDIVICDYSMPRFNGRAALEIFNAAHLDIPFICLSGSLGEERAVEMMRAGAHDYIIKANMSRLAPSVARELQAARNRRDYHRMQKAAAHLAALVESSDDAIISKTLSGVILSWNKAAEHIYGYSADEMIGQSISVLLPPGRISEFADVMEKIRSGQHVVRFDTERLRKDGTLVPVSVTISPIRGPDGEIIAASSIASNISQRQHDEAVRLKLIAELTDALAQAKTLRSLLPICASCKKIRDDHGYWQKLEVYFQEHQHIDFSHGLCPDCAKRLYPEFAAHKRAEQERLAN